MKAIGHTEYGGPEVLHPVAVPQPEPRPRDLLVKVKAFAINPVDIKRRRAGATPLQSPAILGYDGAGIVEGLGAQAGRFNVGDQVYFAGDITRQGCYAEYVAVDERIVGHKPRNLTFAEAAAIPLTALTAWESFFEQMKIDPQLSSPSRTLLVVGGAGGVGSIAIQIAKRVARLRVIATASRPASHEFCREMGADEVIDHARELAPQLGALGLGGVDLILDCADPSNLPQLIPCLNPLGTICCILGGEATKSLDLSALVGKRGTLTFELMFTRPRLNLEPERQGAILDRVADLLDQKMIRTTMTRSMDWGSIEEAHRAIEGGHTLGKIVLEIPG